MSDLSTPAENAAVLAGMPAWQEVIDGLHHRGIPAKITTWAPGWWLILVLTEDPNDYVAVGSHSYADPAHDATIDLAGGPADTFLVYRQIDNPVAFDTFAAVSGDVRTLTTDLDELAAAIRHVRTTPLQPL